MGCLGEPVSVSFVKEYSILSQDITTSGFLIRRLHQIYQSLLSEEAEGLGVTPAQMGVLIAISREPGHDQSSIAEEIGADRATLAAVLSRLEVSGLVRRVVCKQDHRQKLLYLTAKGQRLAKKLAEPIQRANERTLAPLNRETQDLFVKLLYALIDGGNQHARTKLRIPAAKATTEQMDAPAQEILSSKTKS